MKEEKLDFFDSNNIQHMSKLGSDILALCQGKTFNDVVDRLSAKLSPKEAVDILKGADNICNNCVKVMEGLITKVELRQKN